MRALALAILLAGACSQNGFAATAPRAAQSCSAFMADYPNALPAFRVSFERPLTITRDLFGGDDEDGIDVHILADNAGVDGTLRCKGDAFRRFEVRIGADADATELATFTQFEEAALRSFFGWDDGKAHTVVGAMSADAAEYLNASIQRGDSYRSGKVEYHQGSRYDLGLIWTEQDHTFIITTQDGP